ncbi:hypothetical protein NW830_11295 [Synechococcus sp. OH30]
MTVALASQSLSPHPQVQAQEAGRLLVAALPVPLRRRQGSRPEALKGIPAGGIGDDLAGKELFPPGELNAHGAAPFFQNPPHRRPVADLPPTGL